MPGIRMLRAACSFDFDTYIDSVPRKGFFMKLSTSSNIVFDRPDGSAVSMERMMRYAKEAGFDTLDISFYDWSLPGSPFLEDGWRALD